MNINNFYDLSAKSIQNHEISMKEYAGKTILVVNTASKCGLTPQYTGLEQLYQKYKDKGFVILGFPCNQFGNQEPGDEHSIVNTCLRNYGVTFPMMSKISVKGKDIHEVYKFLTQKDKNGLQDSQVEWNFQKYLINEEGELIKVLSPRVLPTDTEIVDWINGK
jgi:glutathione peroxidase